MCYKLEKIFETETDKNGIAVFKIPLGNEYQIDIEGIENFGYIECDVTEIVETALNI